MSAETLRQLIQFLDRQQAEFLVDMQEDRADDVLHARWKEGLIKSGYASEKPTRTQQRWPADEREAERRHAEAKVAVAAVPPHLTEEWLGRLARMLKAHKRLLSHCVAAAARQTELDHGLVQECRELRAKALHELNALSACGSTSGAGPPEQADAADAPGQPTSQWTGQLAPALPNWAIATAPCATLDTPPTHPPSLREQIDAADRRLDGAERRLAEANAALRRFDRRRVFRRLLAAPPGEKTAPVQPAGKATRGEADSRPLLRRCGH